MTKRLSIWSVRPVTRVEIVRGEDAVAAPVFEEFLPETPAEEVVEEPLMRLSDARRQVQNAYDRGFVDGKQVATATMLTEVQRQQEVLKNFDTLLGNLHGNFDRSLLGMERSVVELALVVAGAVVGEEVRRDKSVVIRQVQKSLEALRGADTITVRLNTDDYDGLMQVKSAFITDPARASRVHLLADEGVEPGGCVVESSLGSIDAQLRTQLGKIAETLKSGLPPPAAAEEKTVIPI